MSGPLQELLKVRHIPYKTGDDDEDVEVDLDDSKVLVVGAGGLGGHILKCLGMSGIKDIHVVDLDTLELSNLNRQILFRDADVGQYKADVAARRMNEHLKDMGVKVTAHSKKIQDFPLAWFKQFSCVIAGLDNIEARRFLNATLCQLIEVERNPETGELGLVDSSVRPLIDGGTEGFFGHCRVIIPGSTSCFECSLEAFPPQENFALCTLVDHPRQPEHCIEYALVVLWGRHRPDYPVDPDESEHIQWLYERALERAHEFNIPGVTLQLTMGVAKRIIPAIASTNQLIASLCVNEALKVLCGMYPLAGTYMMYNGAQGCVFNTLNFERKKDCPICSEQCLLGFDIDVTLNTSLRTLVETILPERMDVINPSVFSGSRILYMNLPQFATSEKLDKTFRQMQIERLLPDNKELALSVEAKDLDIPKRVRLHITDWHSTDTDI